MYMAKVFIFLFCQQGCSVRCQVTDISTLYSNTCSVLASLLVRLLHNYMQIKSRYVLAYSIIVG